MKLLIINGSPGEGFEEYDSSLGLAVEELSKRHDIHLFTVRDMDISYCTGCFGCWVKTPGSCVFRDGMDEILKEYPDAEMIVFVSPIVTGFITSLTKKAMDRMIPVVLPYVRLFDNECHHPKRYDAEPVLGLMVYDKYSDKNASDLVFASIDRLNLNLHGKRTFKELVDPKNIKEVLENEIGNH